MSTTIESLELEILSNSTSASSGLEALSQSLGKLKTATAGGLGLKSIANNLGSMATAVNNINPNASSNLTGLVNAIKLLSGVKISSAIGKNIASISTSLNGLKIEGAGNALKIQELVSALAPLSQLPKQNLSSYVTALKNIPTILTNLNNVDMGAFRTKILEVTDAVRPLATEMGKVAAGFASFPTKIQRLITSNEKLRNSNKKVAGSFTEVYYRLRAIWTSVKKTAQVIMRFITESTEYIENVNLFTVSMGEYAGEAKKYAETVSDAMGIDSSDWMRAQGVFMTISTGFGIAGDRAATMSKNLTQLGYDISSFYNISVQDAMDKLKSGLAGELEPLRAIGYDLSQAKLEATALALGIDKSVSSMTQAEKAQLRYYAIMTQVTQVQGDMARTLEDPANQMRVFKAQTNMAAREIGNMFIPALNAILPYGIAVMKVVGALANTFAGLFGYEAPELEDSTSKVVENTDALRENLQGAQDEAKKLKSYMLGFDELNVINPNTDSTEDLLGVFDFDLPEYDFMAGLAESKVNGIVDRMKEWLGITEDIDTWADFFDTKLGKIFKYVGIIGGSLLLWKLGKGFMSGITAVSKLLKTKTAKFAIAATITIMGVDAAKWIIDNTDETIKEVFGIVSAAELALGAILAFSGVNTPLGIALMASGAAQLATTIATMSDKTPAWLETALAATTTTVGAAELAVGAILTFSGTKIPLGIALMASGVATTAATVLNWKAMDEKAKEVVTSLMLILGEAFLAVGAILAFSGTKIPLGIAMMAIGAAELATTIALNWNSLSEKMETVIGAITSILGAALLVVGAVLAFSGAKLPLGIALMAMGALNLGTAIALNWDKLPDQMNGVVGIITASVGAALLAVGAVLAFSGAKLPLGIALMAMGAVSLGTAIALNWEAISTALEGPIGLVTGIVSGALLALGAILAFSSANIPLGIALMAAGAVGLATSVALNWDSIVTAMQGPVGKIMAIAGASALVIGLILLFTGVGIPLGLGLILGGAAALGSAVAFNWDFIVDKVKEVWGKVQGFWNEHIAKVFTAEWWKNLGVAMMNGLIAGIEAGINGIIAGFEWMINKVVGGLNKISISLPDWGILGDLAGKTFGVNITPVSFGRVSIPRFAEGGFPERGQMFIAREAGPELVGNIGKRAAVANNEQIVESISIGVAEANGEQNALLREQNSLLRALLEKDSGVYIDGRSLSESVDKYKREQGRELIVGGVL